MRSFLAIELPRYVVEAVRAAGHVIRELEPEWSGEKWVEPTAMHVTLKFLGDVDKHALNGIAEALAEAVTRQPVFALDVTGLCAVPAPRRASIIWAELEDASGSCVDLAETADRVAGQYGVATERRRFTPHLTLVRARRPRRIDPGTLSQASARAGLPLLEPMSVLSATLFSSTLTKHGPIHERLEEFAFRPRNEHIE